MLMSLNGKHMNKESMFSLYIDSWSLAVPIYQRPYTYHISQWDKYPLGQGVQKVRGTHRSPLAISEPVYTCVISIVRLGCCTLDILWICYVNANNERHFI